VMALGVITVSLLPEHLPRRHMTTKSKAFTVMLSEQMYEELITYCNQHTIIRSDAIREFIHHGMHCNVMAESIDATNELE
jgi:hypothetical protein